MATVNENKLTWWEKFFNAMSYLPLIWGAVFGILYFGNALSVFLIFRFGAEPFSSLEKIAFFLWSIAVILLAITFLPVVIISLVKYPVLRKWPDIVSTIITVIVIIQINKYIETSDSWLVHDANIAAIFGKVILFSISSFYLAILFVKQQSGPIIKEKRQFLLKIDVFEISTLKKIIFYWTFMMSIIITIEFIGYLIVPWLTNNVTISKNLISLLSSFSIIVFAVLCTEFYKSVKLAPKFTELETLLQKKQEELQAERIKNEENKVQAYLGMMATATAHELNQPIGIIRAATSGALEDIAEGLFEPHDIEPLLKRILSQSDRLAAIIDNFRKFARGDRTQREAIDLNASITRVIDNFMAQFQYHHIDLRLETIEPSPMVWANLYQLEEVLINLLTNAKDALEMTPNAQVIVKTWHNVQGESGFTVSDNGPGVPVEYQQKMFLPFVSTKSTHKGTGLGLYIAKRILEEFGGQLIYQDNPTGGACFTVTLPPIEQVNNGTTI